MEIPILYQDEHFIIINKPARILVHPSFYARNIEGPSLVELLEEQLEKKYHPVHRLDHKTTGVLLFTQASEMVATLQKMLEENEIQKEYWALLRGFTPSKGIIDSPVKSASSGNYKAALTHFETVHSVTVPIPVQPYDQSRYSLVKFFPKTGRMHQLRKHANKIAHPIIGDYKYGNRHHNSMFASELGINEMFLHAHSLTLRHPVTRQELIVKAPLPDFWIKLANNVYFDQFSTYLE